MKLTTTLMVVLYAFTTTINAQNVWVADNNTNAPTGSHIYPTIQEAVDAASDGDIVQVQPSPYTYGGAVINKQITLVGIGFNLTKDLPLRSNMSYITLTNNADNTSDADGTIIKGLSFDIMYLASNTGPSYTLENITVYNCSFNYLYTYNNGTYSPVDGIEIYHCSIYNSTIGLILDMPTSNAIIRNNVIRGYVNFSSGTAGSSNIITNNILYDGIYVNAEGTAMTILNNNFIGQTGTETAFNTELKDCIVSNNIFYGSTPSIGATGSTSTAFQRNTFTNNLVYSTGDDTMPPNGGGAGNSGSGNIIASPDFVFVELLNTWSSSYDYSLNSGSPALLAGSDGEDIGITGGAFPWTDANLILKTSATPTIETLNTSTVINPGDDLPVHVKSDSH